MSRSLLGTDSGSWRERLDYIVGTMRALSRESDPQEMVRVYGQRMRQLVHLDGMVSLSRRDLPSPKFRITRASIWQRERNPWKENDQLPLLEGGLLGELIYGDEPRIIHDLKVAADDPGAEYLGNHRSLIAIPNYDQGVALNMVVFLREAEHAFDEEDLPEFVWISNLFGRATLNLVLTERVKQAYEMVDQELKRVADIQRSLLPARIPNIPGFEIATSYETSRRAGGDYYDFFPLPDGKWGILIADVSGHGTPAAVLMAITHSIVHSYPGPPAPPQKMLQFVNEKLTSRYTTMSDSFVTALYAVYDPSERRLIYASAGHNPPRLQRRNDSRIQALDECAGLPLGVAGDAAYEQAELVLEPGDRLVFYTDGVVETPNTDGELFGVERLDEAIAEQMEDPGDLIGRLRTTVQSFAGGAAATDDQTMIAARVG